MKVSTFSMTQAVSRLKASARGPVIQFTILGLWVLGLAISHFNESNCKHMSPEHYFQ